MSQFSIATKISQYPSFNAFIQAYQLSEKDLIITRASIYQPFLQDLNLPCHILLQNEYGQGEPTDIMINKMLEEVKELDYNRVIAIGGGTVIDIAKIFVLEGVEDVAEAFARTIPLVKTKKLLVLPTTCGTGSEVTNISIAEITRKHTKMGLADDSLLPDEAILVPELMHNLPFKPFVCSAIDALIHATESFVSPKANNFTRLFSQEAIHIILDVFTGIAKQGEDYRLQKLPEMLTAATYAGIAFGQAGVGAVHAMSYPLGANYHVPHGESNYQFFVSVFELYHQKAPNGELKQLIDLFNRELSLPANTSATETLQQLALLLNQLLPIKALREFGMQQEETTTFASSVIASQQRLLANNYVPLSEQDIKAIYEARF